MWKNYVTIYPIVSGWKFSSNKKKLVQFLTVCPTFSPRVSLIRTTWVLNCCNEASRDRHRSLQSTPSIAEGGAPLSSFSCDMVPLHSQLLLEFPFPHSLLWSITPGKLQNFFHSIYTKSNISAKTLTQYARISLAEVLILNIIQKTFLKNYHTLMH